MTYEDTLQHIYQLIPPFQQVGAAGYKPGLDNSRTLDSYFGHPHRRYRTIHVGGTNGKGSTSHLLAAILQQSGYKVGLYTSPHLADFRERIRVNGQMVGKEYVVSFFDRHLEATQHLSPSFFEITMMLAFQYFADCEVDVAVIEVGLGGRLDSTNIISPDLSVITNISFDHVQFLGNTLLKIAGEKAGIIKPHIPVVIGEAEGEVKELFQNKASEHDSPICWAEIDYPLAEAHLLPDGRWIFENETYPHLIGELGGLYQCKNAATVLTSLRVLKKSGFIIPDEAVYSGFAQVVSLTGLRGRWQTVQEYPKVICDTGHNVGGITYIVEQLRRQTYQNLRIVIGMVNDKDIASVLALLPQEAEYYFTQASVKRALPAEEFARQAEAFGLRGNCFASIAEAYDCAKKESRPDDLIFVGGSSFVVADLLTAIDMTTPNKSNRVI